MYTTLEVVLHPYGTTIKSVLSSHLYWVKHVWAILVTVSIMLPNCSAWFDMRVFAQVTNYDN